VVSELHVTDAAQELIAHAWALLDAVPDPEIPVVSIRELGILRDVAHAGGALVVTITPTYSGCPAIDNIATDIIDTLSTLNIKVEIKTQLAPAWTTDWMTPEAHRKLREYGIAPPVHTAIAPTGNVVKFMPRAALSALVPCPQCGSHSTTLLSQYGSTACKALYKCLACAEPFDYFKPH
jgi:ring-1,2-phenylacetyl-CoA epoxidase subunit PaaD